VNNKIIRLLKKTIYNPLCNIDWVFYVAATTSEQYKLLKLYKSKQKYSKTNCQFLIKQKNQK